jgi:hypothetical protein
MYSAKVNSIKKIMNYKLSRQAQQMMSEDTTGLETLVSGMQEPTNNLAQ